VIFIGIIIQLQFKLRFSAPETLFNVLRRIEIRASSLSSSWDIYPRCGPPSFFPPRGKPLPWRAPWKLNSLNEPHRAGVIEKTSREIGKEFLSSVRVFFFFFNHRSIRVDYDGKNVLDFSNKFYLLFSQINIFGFVLTCSFFYWIIKLFFIERLDRCIHVMYEIHINIKLLKE